MLPLALLSAAACLMAVVLTRVCRDAALTWGLVDQPDTPRKIHARPVPRIGGVAVALAFSTAIICAVYAGSAATEAAVQTVADLTPAFLVIFATGLIDDVVALRARYKLVGQVIAALCVVAAGIQPTSFAGWDVPEWFGAAVAICWLVVATNAINLIDGLDGLAGGVGVFGCIGIAGAAIVIGEPAAALILAPLAGALSGFLVHNYSPASVFLGDSGSLLTGFALGTAGLLVAGHTESAGALLAPVAALGLPLADTLTAVLRRTLEGRSVFSADRGHIHHRLLDRGFQHPAAVLMLWGWGTGAALLAIVMVAAPLSIALTAFTVAAAAKALALRLLWRTSPLSMGPAMAINGGQQRRGFEGSLSNLHLALAEAAPGLPANKEPEADLRVESGQDAA